jgi:hypothetical protein
LFHISCTIVPSATPASTLTRPPPIEEHHYFQWCWPLLGRFTYNTYSSFFLCSTGWPGAALFTLQCKFGVFFFPENLPSGTLRCRYGRNVRYRGVGPSCEAPVLVLPNNTDICRIWVFTAALTNSSILCDTQPCSPLKVNHPATYFHVGFLLGSFFDPEGGIFLRNVG